MSGQIEGRAEKNVFHAVYNLGVSCVVMFQLGHTGPDSAVTHLGHSGSFSWELFSMDP